MQSWLKLTKYGPLLCVSDVVSDAWFVARFISPDMLYFSPCVNTSRLIWREISHKSYEWRAYTNALFLSLSLSFFLFYGRLHGAVLIFFHSVRLSLSFQLTLTLAHVNTRTHWFDWLVSWLAPTLTDSYKWLHFAIVPYWTADNQQLLLDETTERETLVRVPRVPRVPLPWRRSSCGVCCKAPFTS